MRYQLGPFIDAHHPAIRSGDIDQLPTQIFKDQISSRLNSLLQSSTATTVILVPALRDILSHHVVYPQSPFERDPELGLPARVSLFNPLRGYRHAHDLIACPLIT